jgi:hypothetical protein
MPNKFKRLPQIHDKQAVTLMKTAYNTSCLKALPAQGDEQHQSEMD